MAHPPERDHRPRREQETSGRAAWTVAVGTGLRKLAGFAVIAALIVALVGYYQQRDVPREQPPPLVGESLGGELLDLQQMASSGPVLIYFWATWCGYCRVVSPAIADLAQDHQVITVALQSGSPDSVSAYLRENGLQFPTINDPAGSISTRWGVRVTPTIVIIDSDGEIAWVTSGTTTKWGLQWRLALTD